MITTEINYNGKTYVCRMVKDSLDDDLIIAGLELLDALHPGEYGDELDGFADQEAVKIDEEIFFYASEADLALPDEELIPILKESNPDWFD